MQHIEKGTEPKSLTRARSQKPPIDYGSLDAETKENLRRSLLKEQGHLCAYCMSRLPGYLDVKDSSPEALLRKQEVQRCTKVEHIIPQEDSKEGKQLELRYANLVMVCKGNEGQKPKEQHCDTRKGMKRLHVLNPTDHPERFVRYTALGEILGDRPEAQADLTDILNLNVAKLQEARKHAWKATIEVLSRDKPQKWLKAFLERKIEKLTSPHESSLPEFAGMTVYFLKKKLQKARSTV